MDEKKRGSDPSMHGLPSSVRVDIAKHREALKDKEYDNTYESCCLRMDRRVLEYFTQTLIGVGVITFCAYRLSSSNMCDCSDGSAAYWSLLGSSVGFFLKSGLKASPPKA